MNILLIGNGFDLAHGLPTKYEDFLSFCRKIEQGYDISDYGEISQKQNVIQVIKAKIQENTWYKYFLEAQSRVGENWIDFEREISNIAQALTHLRIHFSKKENIAFFDEKEFDILERIKRKARGYRSFQYSIDFINDFSTHLSSDLENLTQALELYISEIINETLTKENIPVKIILDALKTDRLLSFNYSNTYERIYGNCESVEYCYIHGKADSDRPIEKSDIVLGIDEYLDDVQKNTDFTFLPFKKYYQRIYKGPDNSYLDWVDEIKKGGEHTLTIFGHSLDITDRDVLRLFIDNDNVQTKIYYYQRSENDKTELGKLIRNLIGLLGQDELIRRTGGAHKSIEFLPYCPSKTKELKSSGQTGGERTAP